MSNSRFFSLALALAMAFTLLAPVSQSAQAAGAISLTGGAYTQDFDSLASSATSSTVPTGWDFYETGTSANTIYTAGTGSSTTGDTYSFGATSSTERAFGGLQSGSVNPTVGAQFTNNTGSTITSLQIAYTGEMWRAGVTNRNAADRLDFQYSTDAGSLSTGTWVDVDSLDFNSPNVNVSAGALDGNATANRSAISYTITGLNIPDGASFWIRWIDYNIASSDDGLAIDDFSLTPVTSSSPVLSIADISQAEGNSGTSTMTFTISLSSPAPAGGVTFDIATSDVTATAGSDYVANSQNGVTIAQGDTSTTFDVVINGDTDAEPDETFTVTVSNVVNATAGTLTATGTILNDDAVVPVLSINDVSVTEGDSGTTSASFLISLDVAAPSSVTFDIATADGTATAGSDYTAVSISGATIPTGQQTYTLNVDVLGDTLYEANETFFVNITNLSGAVAADAQGLGTILNDDPTPIYLIQGSGAATTFSGTHTIQGVVIGTFEYQGGSPVMLNGFYVQEEVGDGDPATSDGIFVYTGTNPKGVQIGDRVRVTGTVGEFQNQTQISVTNPANITILGSGYTITPTDITLPFSSLDEREQYEGMLVRFNQTLYVTEHYQLGRFGQVVLSSADRLYQPTHLFAPGSTQMFAQQTANALNQIILDDSNQSQNPDPILFGRGGNPLSASNTLRGGDTVTNLTGVITYTWGGNSASPNAYRIQPVTAMGGGVPNFVAANARPTAAPAVSGTLRVASMNLLNYFNTFGVGNCTAGVGGATVDCRGADNITEFDRQADKIVNAIVQSNAHIIGIMEMENDGYGSNSAIQDLVNRLNAATAPGTYAFIDADTLTGKTNALGTDAIKVGLLYKPAFVTPVGTTAVLDTPAFVTGGDSVERNRVSLLQAFRQDATNEVVLVNVNHLKSKGSACDTPDSGDGQGNCAVVRTNAVLELLGWFATNPTDTSDPDILLIGDLNSYAKEDPIDALEDSSFTNLNALFGGASAYSYVFGAQWGYLDYALANSSLLAQVENVTEWHINADEPPVLDYNTNFKSAGQIVDLYSPDPFRTSDHDPILVDLNLDSTAPAVLSITRADADPTNAASVTFTVTFSKSVTGVDASDFTPTITGSVSGASVTSVSGSGAVYTVTVNTGTGSGTLRLDLNASGTGIEDLIGIPIASGFNSGEVYTLARGPIPNPWVGGVQIESDQSIVAVARPHLGSQIASYIGSGAGSTTQYVPMLFKDAFGGGSYKSALYIQNLGSDPASLAIQFINDSGVVVHTITEPLAAKASKGYWLSSIAGIPAGFAGAAKVTADQPVLAVGRPHIGAEVMSYNGVSTGATTAWLPMFFKNGFGSYNTALYVQNVSASSASLTIEYLNLDGTVACTDTDTLAANASKGYWSLAVTCDTGSLPSGFVGGVKVTSTQNILAVGRAHLGTQITTYNGFAGGATNAYVPMLFKNAFSGGSYKAALYLQNVSASSDTVTIDYLTDTGSVAATQNVTLPAGAISSIWLPSVTGLPDGFVGGARITATQQVIAVGRPHLGSEITAYNGTSGGSTSAYLSMLFKNAFSAPYNAAFYIQNVTGNAATVNISFYDDAGTLSCIKSITLAPNATQGFWMPAATCAP